MSVPDRPTSLAQKCRLTGKGPTAVALDRNRHAGGDVEGEGEGQAGGKRRAKLHTSISPVTAEVSSA